MSREANKTAFAPGEFISGDAVRGVLGRRRRTRPIARTDAVHELPAVRRAVFEAAASPTPTRPLRRWSVAELIARAAPPPRPDGVTH